MQTILVSAALAIIGSLVGTRLAVTWFARLGFGQPIRVDGPTTHQIKRGTPTMGGIVVVLATVVAYLIATFATGARPSASGWLMLLLLVGCGVVGFLDDFIKVYTQDNRGLSARKKIVGQAAVALGFGVLATLFFTDEHGVRPASRHLSTTRDWGWELPLLVVLLLIWFIVTATSNATNILDGADGMLAGSAALVFGAYAVVNLWQFQQKCGSLRSGLVVDKCYAVRDPLDLAIFSATAAAACLGFLWWNAKPARIIMGDVGSLALGGALAGVAIMSRTELLMVVIAGVFVFDIMTVILQTSWFKLTRRLTGVGKRIFPITPIHHHFEDRWGEAALVIRFWIIAGSCVMAGLALFYADWLAR
ncbi:phospho-N-acetylmuramoyl-pentapeptide-transferase [Aestuariimicrobium soli]|uniref:phospho-N-acetylmuramoyl-pentapeptide- transferase n=1 Tax=Aestuariimicrobium soli TaxID=2035834 RepID=UPI003EBA5080